MTTRVTLSEAALQDVDNIADYTLSQWGSRQMKSYLAQIDAMFLKLSENPELGRKHAFRDGGMRSVLAGRHTIYFLVGGEEVEIVRVLHQSQDAPKHLGTSK